MVSSDTVLVFLRLVPVFLLVGFWNLFRDCFLPGAHYSPLFKNDNLTAKTNTTEIDTSTTHPVIDLMEEQVEIENKGGTMRLGAYNCSLANNSLAHSIYGQDLITERHRHRYEFNNKYKDEFTNAGMVMSGINPDNNLVEIVELPDHPWFVGVQFHPEYKSTVANPHPLFMKFVKATVEAGLEVENA